MKIVPPAQAIQSVQSGQRVYLTGNCGVPRVLLQALIERAPQLSGVELCQPLTVTGSEYLSPELSGHLRVNTLFISPNVRAAVNAGRADFTPVPLSQIPLLFKNGTLPLDVALLHCSLPDGRGYCSLGTEAGLTLTIAEAARVRIAEINPQMPRTGGDTLIHVDQLAATVAVDYPLTELPPAEDENREVVEKIARHVAARIPDGATLQLGIGAIPNAILGYLAHKKDLGIHAELLSDGVIDLVEAGVINGTRKTLHPGKLVAGFIFGSRRLHQWVHENPLVELHRTEYVNSPLTVAQNAKMVAINSALEIDLTGQVCADSIGTRLYSGVGGQFDFIYGASLAPDGLPVIVLPSTVTARDGKIHSRIVPTLKPGAGVTLTRNHVHWVASEYGMVDLYGKTIRQRAQLLISIAHPTFRDDLIAQAHGLGYLE
jgi:acetyl-CoA hydrolase